jgi:hypothetical protein
MTSFVSTRRSATARIEFEGTQIIETSVQYFLNRWLVGS